MLTENDVVAKVCAHLEHRGWVILRRLTTSQQGHDIVAQQVGKPGRELRIEAKGETSSKSGSRRFGMPFDSSQVDVHVALAFFAAVTMQEEPKAHRTVSVAMAFPKTVSHLRRIERISPTLKKLGIGVFWVADDGTVTLNACWGLS